jgi:CRP/FNR family transcriptional regulator
VFHLKTEPVQKTIRVLFEGPVEKLSSEFGRLHEVAKLALRNQSLQTAAGVSQSPSIRWRCEAYEDGDALVAQGARVERVFLVESGLLKLVCSDSRGKHAAVGLRGVGAFLAPCGLLEDSQSLTNIVSIGKTRVRSTLRRHLIESARKDNAIAESVLQLLAQESEELLRQLAASACCSAREMLIRILEMLASTESARSIELPFPDWQLAELLNITPEYLSRLFRRLSNEGCLVRTGSTVTPLWRRAKASESAV